MSSRKVVVWICALLRTPMDDYTRELFDRIEELAAKSNVTLKITLNVPGQSAPQPANPSEPSKSTPKRRPRAGDLVLASLWKNPDWIGESISKLARRFNCATSTLSRDKEFITKYQGMCRMVVSDKAEGIYDSRRDSFDGKVEDENEWSE